MKENEKNTPVKLVTFVKDLKGLIPADNYEAHGRLTALQHRAVGSDELDSVRAQIMNKEERIDLLKEQVKGEKKRLDGLKEEESELISRLSDDMDMVTRANLETEWLMVQAQIEDKEPLIHTVLLYDTDTETFLGTLKKLTKEQLERAMELGHRFAKTEHFMKPRCYTQKDRVVMFKERHEYLIQNGKVQPIAEAADPLEEMEASMDAQEVGL